MLYEDYTFHLFPWCLRCILSDTSGTYVSLFYADITEYSNWDLHKKIEVWFRALEAGKSISTIPTLAWCCQSAPSLTSRGRASEHVWDSQEVAKFTFITNPVSWGLIHPLPIVTLAHLWRQSPGSLNNAPWDPPSSNVAMTIKSQQKCLSAMLYCLFNLLMPEIKLVDISIYSHG